MYNENMTDLQLENMPTIEDGLSTISTPRRVRTNAREQKLQKNAKRFYRIYFIVIAVILCALLVLMIPLRNWLERFETTQPDHHSQIVFDDLFARQNWGKVYDAANLEGSEFETREDFIAYMQAKVNTAQGKEFSFYETSAGLSKDHKYIVQLGDEKIATFTLAGSVNEKTNMTEWSISSLLLNVGRSHSVRIQRLPGYTVLVNGKTLSDDYVVRTITTKAEEYLPEGVHGYTLQELLIEGLMAAPTVEVKDENGNTVPTIFSVADNCYKLDLPAPEMTDAEREVILGAAKANALFAIRAITTADLRTYFDPSTQIYKDICDTPTFVRSFISYNFDETVTNISDFYRYSDDLFSARVTLQLDIIRQNGTVKKEMNTTYLFAKNDAGTFMVSNISNMNLQEQNQQVRLRFDCYDEIISTAMVDTTVDTIDLPQFDIAPGDTFLGWASKSVADNGQVTMTILFEPGETGRIPADLKLEPMTLYAVFE